MTDLNAQARALIDGYRRACQPSPGLREQMEFEIARRAQRRRTTIAAGCAAVVAVAAAMIVVISGSDGGTQATDATVGAGHMAADQPRAAPQRRVLAPPAPERSASKAPPPPALSPSPESDLGAAPPQPRILAVRMAPAAPSDATPTASLLLLRKAQRSLASDPNASLQHLARYQRLFGLEHAAHEWRALRVLALCGSGNRLQGRDEGAALARVHPHSPYADRIAAACAGPDRTP